MPDATNKSKKSDFANFDPKIGCHGNVRWAIGKGGRSAIYDQMPNMWWNVGENWLAKSWVLFAQTFI